MFLLYLRPCMRLHTHGMFGCNTLIYKQLAQLLLVLALFPASAFGQVTFSRDVAPVVFTKCTQCHHPGGSAPFSLVTYAEARTHATQMAIVARNRIMPPWKVDPAGHEFIGLDPLTHAEIATLERWVADGVRDGDRRDLPPSPARTGGWQLGQPDLIVTMPAPFVLPAEGADVSRVFVLPLPVDRQRYVRGIEFRASNPRIHHANIRIDATSASRALDEQDTAPGYDGIIVRSAVYPDGHFLGWTPGQAAPLLPAGLAWTLAPRSVLVVQLHLVPSGKPELIQPSIGLYFTDDPATLPDGSSRTLISIADWDLRWQHVYRYQTPLPLPKGTTVSLRYRYDNSGANPRNPAVPPVRVPWGQQSREEMGDLWLQVATRTPAERQLLDRTFHAKWMATDAIGLESLIRRHPDRPALRDDVAVLYMELNRPGDAVPHFEAALRLKPGSAAAYFNYGTAPAGAERREAAVAQYQRALALRPDYAIAHNNLGTALLQLGRSQPALASFGEAARIDPQMAEAHVNVGLISRAIGDYPEAVARFRRAVELNPEWVIALSILALSLPAAIASMIRSHRALFRAHRPNVSPR